MPHPTDTKFVLALTLTLLLFPPTASATHLHWWEAGFGLGVIHAPFYRGSALTKDYFVPIPFIRFRGRIFSADEEGIRGTLFDSDRLTLDLSIAGNVPVPKSEDGARKAMPSLDPLAEIGPALQYRIWRNPERSRSLTFELPVRAVISVGDPLLAHQGWNIAPFVQYLYKKRSAGIMWRYALSAGPLFADNSYHNYFYQVQSQYETAERKAYNASSGYSGSRLTFTLSRNAKHSFLGFFARYDDLHGATFNDSPLVEQSDYFVYGIAAVWIFAHSEERAPHYVTKSPGMFPESATARPGTFSN